MKQPQRPTLEDVAKAAEVSTATISRCINQPTKVAVQTRERIEKAIEELGYTPDFGGRSLASGRSNTVGAIIPTMSNAMFASGLQAFTEILEESGITLLVATSGYDSEDEMRQIRSLISRGADGLLLIGEARPPATLEFLKRRKIPCVVSWCYQADSDQTFAGFNNFSAATALTLKVLEMGHRHIAMIAGVCRGNDRAQARLDGVEQAIENYADQDSSNSFVKSDSGIAVLHSVKQSPYSLDDGGDAFETILAENPEVTAIICGNDVIAAGAIVRARKLGIDVPGKISITGFDDIILATAVQPALTTVKVPQLEMGRAAATMLLEMINHNTTPSSIELPTSVIIRDSLASPI